MRARQALAESDLSADDQTDEIEATIANEFGDGVNYKVEIYRVTGDTGSRGAFLGSHPPDQLQTVKDRCLELGTGSYRVVVKRNGKFFREINFAVEKIAGRPSPAAAPVAESSSLVESLLRRLDERDAKLITLIETRTTHAPADPYDQMQKMAGILASLRATGTESTAGASTTAYLDAVNKGIELGKVIAGGAAGEERSTGLMDIIGKLAENPAVGSALEMLIARAAAPAPAPVGSHGGGQNNGPRALPRAAVVTPPTAPPPVSRETPPPAPADPAAQLDEELRLKVTYLIDKAEGRANPELYAEWLMDDLNPALLAFILQTANVIDQLALAFPALQQPEVKRWFELLRGHMVRMDQENGESDLTAGVATGTTISPDADR